MKKIPILDFKDLVSLHKGIDDAAMKTPSLFDKYGDIIEINFLFNKIILTRNPYHINHILHEKADNYFERSKFVVNQFYDWSKNQSLLTNNNKESWQKDRDIIMKYLLDPEFFMPFYSDVIVTKTNEMLNDWEKKYKNGDKIFWRLEIDKLLIKIMFNTLIKDDIKSNLDEMVIKVYNSNLLSVQKIFPIQNILLHLQPRKLFNYNQIKNYINSSSDQIVIDRLLSKKKYDDAIGALENVHKNLPIQELQSIIVSHIKIFAFTNAVTTTNLTSVAMGKICHLPYIEKKIIEESFDLIKSNNLNYSTIPKLKYLSSFMKELVRFNPIVFGAARGTKEDDVIDGYHIPAKSHVVALLYAMHRDKKFWQHPEAFYPERFIDKPFGQDEELAFLPFGSGERSCMGRSLSTIQFMHIIPMILNRFRLELPSDHNSQSQWYPTFHIYKK